jgi:hypothetical protein
MDAVRRCISGRGGKGLWELIAIVVWIGLSWTSMLIVDHGEISVLLIHLRCGSSLLVAWCENWNFWCETEHETAYAVHVWMLHFLCETEYETAICSPVWMLYF